MRLPAPETLEVGEDLAELDSAVARIPNRPAVFLLWPREGEPYLSRTTLLRRRLVRLVGPRPQPSRLLNLRAVVARIEYWFTHSRVEALLLYYELARRHFPERYLDLLKLRMPPYVKLVLSNPFPRSQVTTRLSGGQALFYGPFRNRPAAERFESGVLDLFQMRRCQEDLEPSASHPGCIYGEMSMCLRPCQLAVGREEYLSEVRRVQEFLVTDGHSLLETVAGARDRFSQEMEFEEAARQHKRLEKIEQVVKLGDELARDIDRLYGVSPTSPTPGAVDLWFVCQGCWLDPVRLDLQPAEGKMVSLDQRLREMVAGLQPRRLPARVRQEHLALLARWFYSSWHDSDWIAFDGLEQLPYRKLVRAISRAAAQPVSGY